MSTNQYYDWGNAIQEAHQIGEFAKSLKSLLSLHTEYLLFGWIGDSGIPSE
jgi:hypothetical protein